MASDGEGSVTRWFDGLRAGEPEAARQLWGRYFDDLVRLARARLRDAPRGVSDEEDAALSAFESLCRGTAAGHFPRLDDRQDLWRVLVTITARKAADLIEHQRRARRGGGRVLSEAALAGAALEADGVLDQIPGRGPSPEMAALVVEEYRLLFGLLPDGSLRLVALMRLEGHADAEIAASLDCGLRSVERKLGTIRKLWAGEVGP